MFINVGHQITNTASLPAIVYVLVTVT